MNIVSIFKITIYYEKNKSAIILKNILNSNNNTVSTRIILN